MALALGLVLPLLGREYEALPDDDADAEGEDVRAPEMLVDKDTDVAGEIDALTDNELLALKDGHDEICTNWQQRGMLLLQTSSLRPTPEYTSVHWAPYPLGSPLAHSI